MVCYGVVSVDLYSTALLITLASSFTLNVLVVFSKGVLQQNSQVVNWGPGCKVVIWVLLGRILYIAWMQHMLKFCGLWLTAWCSG